MPDSAVGNELYRIYRPCLLLVWHAAHWQAARPLTVVVAWNSATVSVPLPTGLFPTGDDHLQYDVIGSFPNHLCSCKTRLLHTPAQPRRTT